MENSLWVEKYRPKDLSTYVGNEHLKEKVKVYLESGDVPHLLLYGRAGTGKTTLAKLIVNNIECDYLYINASDERNIDLVRDKLKTFASSVGFKPFKVVILDEADYLNPQSAQPALRNLMETFSHHCRFILTGNYVERIIDPIQSRCQSYKVVPPSRKEVAQQMVHILDKEGCQYELNDVALIVNAGYPDIRRVINSAQRQIVDGRLKIDESSVIQNDYKNKLIELLASKINPSMSVTKLLPAIRQLIADNSVSDYAELYRLLYDEVDTYGGGKVAECILNIAEAQYQDSIVVDKEINFMSLIVRILRILK
jgi:DNA polymerase III delta prime subunit